MSAGTAKQENRRRVSPTEPIPTSIQSGSTSLKKRLAANSVAVRKKTRTNSKTLSTTRPLKITNRKRKAATEEPRTELVSMASQEEPNVFAAFPEEIVAYKFAAEEAMPPVEEALEPVTQAIDMSETAVPTLAIENEDRRVGAGLELQTIAEPTPPVQLSATTDESPQLAAPRAGANFLAMLMRAWQWAQKKFKSHQVKKRLRVCESVSLGEKRFIAVIQVDGEQFLVGGSSNSVSTLAHLEKPKNFPDIFHGYEQDLSQA